MNALLNYLSSCAAIPLKTGHFQLRAVNALTNWSLTPATYFVGIIALIPSRFFFFFLKKFAAVVQLEQLKEKKSQLSGLLSRSIFCQLKGKHMLMGFEF